MAFEAAPMELKVEVLKRLAAGERVKDICHALDVSHNSVYRWKHDPEVQAAAGVEFLKKPPRWVEEDKEGKKSRTKPLRTRRGGKQGRPTPIADEKLRERFLDACALAVSPRHLGDLLGVSPATIKNWLKSAEKGEGPAAEWGQEIRQATAEGVVSLHERIAHGESGWKAAAWLLAHRYPDIYSERREIVSTNQDPTDELSDEELLDIIGEEPIE